MQVLIVEDERPAAERLRALLNEYDPSIVVVGCTESIEETVQFLKTRKHPDLLLVDIHLSDGHSFAIFEQIEFNNPIIFTTAYDGYVLNALKLLSIDYILKPVSQQAIAKALNKLQSFAAVFSSPNFSRTLAGLENQQFKNRFLGKIGQRLFFVQATNISFFRAENKIVFLVDKEGSRYVIDYTLEKLEQILDPAQFYRVNRSYLINHSSIKHIKNYFNNRLRLVMEGGIEEDEIVISRERVTDFKNWADS